MGSSWSLGSLAGPLPTRTIGITIGSLNIKTETVTIPVMSEMVFPGKINDTAPLTQGIVESCGRQLCGGNITLAPVVVNPAEEVLPLRVMNMSSEPQTLYRDTHVTTCKAVASVGVPLSSEKANSQPVDVDKLQLPEHVQQMIADTIVQAPAAMIIVDGPMQLAPVADVVVAAADMVVAAEEGAPQEAAAEEVVPEEVAQEELVPEEVEAEIALGVTEMVVEEVDGVESSGSWREVEEVDVLEPPVSDEGVTSPVVEIGCARVISLDEYRNQQLEVGGQQSARVATLVSDDGGELAPLIPDKRRVVLSGTAGSLKQLMARPSGGKRHREERVEKQSKEVKRKRHRENRKCTKTRKSHSKWLSLVDRAALRAVLFPPRVQLVDCMPLTGPKQMLPDD